MEQLKIEMAGNVEYNGINCRLRTAFTNKRGEQYYLEISSGHAKDDVYIVINFLYRIDTEDVKTCYTKSLYDAYIKDYHTQHRCYTHENVVKLIRALGCEEDIMYCDNYVKKEYSPHTDVYKIYNLGNKKQEMKQLSIFDI